MRTRRRPLRLLLLVLCAALVTYLGLSAYAFVYGLKGLRELKTAADELQQGYNLILVNPDEAAALFAKSQAGFTSGVTLFQNAPTLVKLGAFLPPVRWQVNASKSAYYLSQIGATSAKLVASYPRAPKIDTLNTFLRESSGALFSWYESSSRDIDTLQQNLQLASRELQDVPQWLPGVGDSIAHLTHITGKASLAVPNARGLLERLREDLYSATYLVIFQNDGEQRPSGGFIGSYALLEGRKGYVESFTFGRNIYKFDKGFEGAAKLQPPLLFREPAYYWSFRDSNVRGGFRDEIAADVMRMFQLATLTSTQGVLFLDTSVLEDALLVTGPIQLPNLGQPITSENVSTVLQEYVEKSYFTTAENLVTNEPKSILGDLVPILLDKISTSPGAVNKIIPALSRAVSRKSIQFSFANPVLNERVNRFTEPDSPLAGRNWLKVVNSNLVGGKSSRYVSQDVSIERLSSIFGPNRYRVSITRNHTGPGTWPDANNNNFVDLYLPVNAIIERITETKSGTNRAVRGQLTIKENMQTISRESEASLEQSTEWTKLSWWMDTNIGKTSAIEVTYTTEDQPDTVTYLKQAGTRNERVRVNNGPWQAADSNLTLSW